MTYKKTLTALAPAKINLGLNVLERRADGFHDIRTTFVALEWYDRITIGPALELTLTCSDSRLPTNRNNLAIQAAELLRAKFGVSDGASIHLQKNLPFGAGLGGGSSDAATTLSVLNRIWDLKLTFDQLASLALEIGSDVPFFLDPRPAIGEGRGERLTYLNRKDVPALFEDKLWVCVVSPDLQISTADAYRRVKPNRTGARIPLSEWMTQPRERWCDVLTNDFEGPVFAWYPQLSHIKAEFLAGGAFYASLSGSGSSVFGLFDSRVAANRAAEKSPYLSWAGRILKHTPSHAE